MSIGARSGRFGGVGALLVAALLAVPGAARAEALLEARHQVVSVEAVDGGSVLTVDLTLRNSGDQTLDAISVAAAGIVFTGGDAERISFDTLHPGAQLTRRWILSTSQTDQLDILGKVIGAQVTASANGDVVNLSVASLGDTP